MCTSNQIVLSQGSSKLTLTNQNHFQQIKGWIVHLRYFLCLLLLGIPLFFMENVLGQYTGTSATKVAKSNFETSVWILCSDLPSPCAWSWWSWLRPPLHSHHDCLLLHGHHGLGFLFHVPGHHHCHFCFFIKMLQFFFISASIFYMCFWLGKTGLHVFFLRNRPINASGPPIWSFTL